MSLNKIVGEKTIKNSSLIKKNYTNSCKIDEKAKKKSLKLKVENFFFFLSGIFFEILPNNKLSERLNIKPVEAIEINTSKLGLVRENIINEKFLFSQQTTQKTIIETEIEEMEDDEFRYKNWKNIQIGFAIGGSGIGMWFAYKGLNAWEQWMKEQEQKDIEEEIEMTGTYIDPGAGSIEASIDPLSGKKIIIKKPDNEKNTKDNNLNINISIEDEKKNEN